jgi:hypothetical protein
MPILFSYGTLRDAGVQIATFGTRLTAQPDSLPGYELTTVKVGPATYRNVVSTRRPDASVDGVALEVTDAQLTAADDYERSSGYVRMIVPLASGRYAWVYFYAGHD